jgi:hypothetical protein
MSTTSISGYVYYVSFIDDFSRKTCIYFLKNKDKVFNKFKEFKVLVENLSERKIKVLRSDNGEEFTSSEFKEFCREAGIKRELSNPYNPQQNGVIEEEVYVEQPQEFATHESQTHVSRLKKALYGLKQAHRTWYGRIDNFLMSLGFIKSKAYSNLYYNIENDDKVILLLYVDDLFLTRNEKLITNCKKKLASEFEMKDLGQMHYFLGLEVWQNQGEICLSQGKYVVEILKKFGMMDCKSITTPMTTNPKLLCDTSSKIVDATFIGK